MTPNSLTQVGCGWVSVKSLKLFFGSLVLSLLLLVWLECLRISARGRVGGEVQP